MRKTTLLLAALAAAALSGCNCGGGLCDRSESLEMAKKEGTCGGEGGRPLGPRAQCGAAITSCSPADERALSAMLDCLEKLPVCTQAQAAGWAAQRQTCFQQVLSLSQSCTEALFHGVLPGQDGGGDGGPDGGADAGWQPITDGGGAIELVVVADETDFALAWTPTQRGNPASWEVVSENVIGLRFPELTLPAARLSAEVRDAGTSEKRSFFLVGLDQDGGVVIGQPHGGDGGAPDGGGCKGPLECNVDKVCNLGKCETQACVPPKSDTCPPGYLCNGPTASCVRIYGPDGGGIDAGLQDGGSQEPQPFISEMVTVTTGAPSFSPEVFVSRFPLSRFGPDLVAIDSARQYVAMEQENQLFGHLTVNRGKDFSERDLDQTFHIDTLGSRVKLAWLASNQSLLACYNVGLGVRVRRSLDLGRSWPEVTEVVNENPDGGAPTRIQDCDLAPWTSNNALMVTREEDLLTLRVVTASPFGLTAPEVVFASFTGDGGIFNPERAAIATLPEETIVHVGFTGSRIVSSVTDTEVYGAYRGPGSGGSWKLSRINRAGTATGTPLRQDHVGLAVDPRTKRGVAAFSSEEAPGGVAYTTVYVSIWDPQSLSWVTGSDLTVFARNTTGTEYLLLPERPLNETWDAFSPSVAATPSGKIFLSFLAGKQRSGVGLPARYAPHLVGFDLEKTSPLGTGGKGWYLAPARKLGPTSVVDPSSSGSAVMPTWSALAADSQLSVYLSYVEGAGPMVDQPGRAILVSRP